MAYEVGEAYQINVKSETPGERGIPKRPVDSAWIKHEGIVGDFNKYRRFQLRPGVFVQKIEK